MFYRLLQRGIERIRFRLEVRARVDALTIKLQRVEIVTDIVMVSDRFAIAQRPAQPSPAQIGKRVSLYAHVVRLAKQIAEFNHFARSAFETDRVMDAVFRELAELGVKKSR
jgi:hypothetical protein